MPLRKLGGGPQEAAVAFSLPEKSGKNIEGRGDE